MGKGKAGVHEPRGTPKKSERAGEGYDRRCIMALTMQQMQPVAHWYTARDAVALERLKEDANRSGMSRLRATAAGGGDALGPPPSPRARGGRQREHWVGWRGTKCLVFFLYAHGKRARK
jgi:hypothetical protein